MISPGVFASVRRFAAAHSSIRVAWLDLGVSGGDQDCECVLKSPISRVGVVALMSRSSNACHVCWLSAHYLICGVCYSSAMYLTTRMGLWRVMIGGEIVVFRGSHELADDLW